MLLQVLHLDGNPSIIFVGEQAQLEHSSLRHVTLDEAAVQDNLQALGWMPELSELHVASSGMGGDEDEIIQAVETALQGAVAVTAGPGPHLSANSRFFGTLQESSPDVWGPKVQARQKRLAEERRRAHARERAALVGQLAVGTAAGAASGAAVHIVQRLCTR